MIVEAVAERLIQLLRHVEVVFALAAPVVQLNS
jgi:hypothetical protein